MKIDFLSYKTLVKSVPVFGLIDPDDRDGKKSAYVSYDRSESACDAMLLTSAAPCFVILKDQREAFLSKAVMSGQLVNSWCEQ